MEELYIFINRLSVFAILVALIVCFGLIVFALISGLILKGINDISWYKAFKKSIESLSSWLYKTLFFVGIGIVAYITTLILM